jgi:O-antigen/teichoic acid export membrane protein
MKQQAKKLIKHPLIYGSSIAVLGSLGANFLHFLFNLYISRNLPVAEYGIYASVMSLVFFPGLIAAAVTPVVIRFAGDYFATDNHSMLLGLYRKVSKILFGFGIIIFLSFLIFIPAIGNFFHIENRMILLMANFIIFFGIISVINTAFLQAKLSFLFQGFINFVNAVIKLALGIILIISGYSVFGATIAMVIASIASYLLSFIPLRFILDKKIETPTVKTKDLFSFGLPSTLTLIGLTSFISTDIMLVKHFFNPHQAGLYAGMSLIGRVIFFVSAPIGNVMFPLIVQKYSKNENFTNTFKMSLLLVFIPSIILAILYALYPNLAIQFFLKKEEYFAVSYLLAPFAVFIVIFSLLSILCNFYLSIRKTKVFIPVVIGAMLQIILIYIFHQTFLQVVIISLIITFLLVLCLLLYYPYATRPKL